MAIEYSQSIFRPARQIVLDPKSTDTFVVRYLSVLEKDTPHSTATGRCFALEMGYS